MPAAYRSPMCRDRRRVRNDVDAALRQGAAHVDAVEIDPVMNEIGRNDHPDRPYSNSRVTIHIEDGAQLSPQAPAASTI